MVEERTMPPCDPCLKTSVRLLQCHVLLRLRVCSWVAITALCAERVCGRSTRHPVFSPVVGLLIAAIKRARGGALSQKVECVTTLRNTHKNDVEQFESRPSCCSQRSTRFQLVLDIWLRITHSVALSINSIRTIINLLPTCISKQWQSGLAQHCMFAETSIVTVWRFMAALCRHYLVKLKLTAKKLNTTDFIKCAICLAILLFWQYLPLAVLSTPGTYMPMSDYNKSAPWHLANSWQFNLLRQ